MLPRIPRCKTTFARLMFALLALLWSATGTYGMNGRASGASPGTSAFARPEFEALWARTDAPVASRAASRSWLWGPAPGVSLRETFAQATDGTRLVQYFDKARMELNTAIGDPADPWRVTTGLLVSEMVQGRIQTGEREAVNRAPSNAAVAGDAGEGNPRYSDFGGTTLARRPERTGLAASDVLTGSVDTSSYAVRSVRYSSYVPETGHNIPDVMWNYLSQPGPLPDGTGEKAAGPLFDWVYVMGYPITEAYWVNARIGGEDYPVMVQLFQRRTLTYTSTFPGAWRVQMGNVGQHYLEWRYGPSSGSGGPTSEGVEGDGAYVPPQAPETGTYVGINGRSLTYVGREVKIKGTNYWLHNQPFVKTWAEWDGPQAQAELLKARELGVNTIRIGIPFDHSATMDVVWDDDPIMRKVSTWIIDQMRQLLQIASGYGMKVVFVLFEWYDRYPAEGSREERANLAYLDGIVGAFANDDRVLAWDLHNEPDKYGGWEGGNRDEVIDWLRRMAVHTRGIDRQHLVTVGVGDYSNLWTPASDGATILSFVDIASFHCYDAGSLEGQIRETEQHTTKPVFLEEMGWPTAAGDETPPANATYDEATQVFLYTTMLAAAKQEDIAGVAQWTLWDYTPRSTTGGRSNFEEYFGLVRIDGTLKPAAGIFKDDYSARALPSTTSSGTPLTPAGKRNKQP